MAVRAATTPRISVAALAKKTGVSKETVRRWRSGQSEPSAEQMAILEDLGIAPMRAWSEDDSSPAPLETDDSEDDDG